MQTTCISVIRMLSACIELLLKITITLRKIQHYLCSLFRMTINFTFVSLDWLDLISPIYSAIY